MTGSKRILIAGNDEYRVRNRRAFKKREGAFAGSLGYAVIVEIVAGDKNEVYLMLRGLDTKLLQRLEPGFFYPLARALVEPGDLQAQVKPRGV
jgi:hypothetical protein